MFSMQHTLLTACYANMSHVCVFVDVCVVSITLSLSCSLLLSAAGWLVIRWREAECDSVIIRADMCRWPRDVPACWEFWGNSAVSHSLSSLSLSPALFFFCYNIPADICFPSSLQSLWCLLGRHIRAQGVWKWFDLPLWKLHYLGHSPTLGLRGVMLDLQQVCEDPERHWHQASLTSSDTNRNCSRPEKCASMRQIWRQTKTIISVPLYLSFCISSTSFQLVDLDLTW